MACCIIHWISFIFEIKDRISLSFQIKEGISFIFQIKDMELRPCFSIDTDQYFQRMQFDNVPIFIVFNCICAVFHTGALTLYCVALCFTDFLRGNFTRFHSIMWGNGSS